MDAIASKADLANLAQLFAHLAYVKDGTGILMANGQWQGLPAWLVAHASVQHAIAEIESLTGLTARHAMINRMPPGARSGWHVDPTPGGIRFSRWHLPVVTNAKAVIGREEMLWMHLPAGFWYGPVLYWELHAVENGGDEPRTHFIVDLEEES